MAARKNKGTAEQGWPEQTRSRIQTSMLLNRLADHVVGKVELQPTQVKAAEILLRKVLPDLSAVEGNLNVSVSHEDVLSRLEQDAGLTEATTEVAHDAAYH